MSSFSKHVKVSQVPGLEGRGKNRNKGSSPWQQLVLKQGFHSLPLKPLCTNFNTASSIFPSFLLPLLYVARLLAICLLSSPDVLPMICLHLTVHLCSHLLSSCPVPGTVLSPDPMAVTKTTSLPQYIYTQRRKHTQIIKQVYWEEMNALKKIILQE